MTAAAPCWGKVSACGRPPAGGPKSQTQNLCQIPADSLLRCVRCHPSLHLRQPGLHSGPLPPPPPPRLRLCPSPRPHRQLRLCPSRRFRLRLPAPVLLVISLARRPAAVVARCSRVWFGLRSRPLFHLGTRLLQGPRRPRTSRRLRDDGCSSFFGGTGVACDGLPDEGPKSLTQNPCRIP